VFVAILAFATSASNTQAQQHPFTVRDSIELTTFNEPSELEHNAKPIFSPDGKHFLVVTSRGIVDSDQVESVLWLYDTSSVAAFLARDDRPAQLRPRQLTAVISSPTAFTLDAYAALITDPRWSADSKRVYFLGQTDKGFRQLYELNLKTTVSRRLTPLGYDVLRFAVAAGMSAALISRPIVDMGYDPQFSGDLINKDARAVTGLPISTILFPQTPGRWEELRDVQLWIEELGTRGHLVNLDASSRTDIGAVDILSLSPKGRWMVRLLPVKSVPPAWANYEPNPVLSYGRINPDDSYNTSPSNVMRLKSYALIDVRSGKEAFRIDGPNARPLGLGLVDQAVWSPDEHRLLLANTYLPMAGVDEQERERRLRPCIVAEVEVPSWQTRCIAFSRFPESGAEPPWLREVSLGPSDNEVILRYFGSLVERYHLEGSQWVLEESTTNGNDQQRSRSAASPSRLVVTIRQSLNASPALWVEDPATGKSRQLWDPNPQLVHMSLGEATTYHWKDANGLEWTGGLIKPIDYVPGRRYPLVIQTHGFDDGIFKGATDGSYPTAMAARPLASAGIMVLQVPDNTGKYLTTPSEAQRHVEGFRSAIAQLTAESLIDPERVGIIGFSRTCWYVESALIKYATMFAAATIADGVDESYMQYHLYFDTPSFIEEFEKINEGKPFGDGLKKWVQAAPGFHLDQVKTPLRIEAIGQRSLLREWEIYSSLKVQSKPVDLIYIPNGQHVLQRPLDRLASQQGNVDWFQFWLVGCEDQDANRRRQFRRWEALDPARATQLTRCRN
jgi:dipeptidyl aminopeptidase/acylaminoacyl peptidase